MLLRARRGWFMESRWVRWLTRRLPAAREITLNRGTIFIVPAAAGAALLGLGVLLWLTATNYENNLVFAVACLIASVFHTAIYHAYANLSGLTIAFVRSEAAFAGEQVRFVFRLSSHGKRTRGDLFLTMGEQTVIVSGLRQGEAQEVTLLLPAPRRGWIKAERLWIESRYPLGLLRVWSRPLLEGTALVYPAPQPAMKESADGIGSALHPWTDEPAPASAMEGGEDFAGLRPWRRGDHPQRVAWHRVAQEQGVLVKQYLDAQPEGGWVDWYAYPHLDCESRLSAMCAELLDQAAQGRRYGLRLPSLTVEPGEDEEHRLACLRALALFELPAAAQGELFSAWAEPCSAQEEPCTAQERPCSAQNKPHSAQPGSA